MPFKYGIPTPRKVRLNWSTLSSEVWWGFRQDHIYKVQPRADGLMSETTWRMKLQGQARPIWYDGLRANPPTSFGIAPKWKDVKKVFFPETRLAKSYAFRTGAAKDHRWVETVLDEYADGITGSHKKSYPSSLRNFHHRTQPLFPNPVSGRHNMDASWEFARRQWLLMKAKGYSENEAFLEVKKTFKNYSYADKKRAEKAFSQDMYGQGRMGEPSVQLRDVLNLDEIYQRRLGQNVDYDPNARAVDKAAQKLMDRLAKLGLEGRKAEADELEDENMDKPVTGRGNAPVKPPAIFGKKDKSN
eukprot:TRINITY_DN578_c0_g1_i1.p1 TRINITY_DN578_c0_g1~~TRINITY_DN578_c0_g1_i1.p1  ORF type:complete len:301 (+),score=79.20 TRINITY_DN578_c0_g1_i1:55-957(+)